MALDPGTTAPDFTLYTSGREPWTLSEHLGRPLLLLFFPGAFTSVCTDELVCVSNGIEQYEQLGAVVVGISTDSPPVLKQFARANDLPMTLLSDLDADMAAAYGAKFNRDFGVMKLDRIARRAAFVIDTDRILRYCEVLQDAEIQPDFQASKAVLAELHPRSAACGEPIAPARL